MSLLESPTKWGYRDVIIFMATPGLLVFLFITANYLGVKPHALSGVFIGETQDWSPKYSYRCNLRFQTKIGIMTDSYAEPCKHVWKVGRVVELKVGIGRITGGIIGGIDYRSQQNRSQPTIK